MDEIIEYLESIKKDEMSDKLERLKTNAILSIADFKRELERVGLMNKELEEFIENYIKFDNVWRG